MCTCLQELEIESLNECLKEKQGTIDQLTKQLKEKEVIIDQLTNRLREKEASEERLITATLLRTSLEIVFLPNEILIL